MIEAGLVFDGDDDAVLSTIVALPHTLRPVHFSHEEKTVDTADRVEDIERFSAFRAKSQSGFFLLGDTATYSIRRAPKEPLICDCFMDVPHEVAKQFLLEMSSAQPMFGFACAPAEREFRNRITVRQGANRIDSWVGRDIQKRVPGFYWLTLLSDSLANRHDVPIAAVAAVAKEHMTLEGGQHLFRFYERPEDWQTSNVVTELCASLPGVFDVGRVKPQVLAARNFLELNSLLRDWR